ncbi:MAG: FAD:protein FMN transferase [Clostridia bacterium]|nr:FAD:protein FMN transferase [Clostridia bacterium]
MKRILCLLLCVPLLFGLTACGGAQKYTADTFAFDTVISLVAYCDSEEQFQTIRKAAFDRIQELHKKFDIYNEYEGMNNLCTVNRLAGQPVEVDKEISDLILNASRGWYHQTDGRVNIAQGKLYGLWRQARETGILPTDEAIREAMAHGRIEDVVIGKKDGSRTITLKDPEMALDVGAVAKGYAAQQAAMAAAEAGGESFAISAGGNVVVWGDIKGRPWNVGIRDPRSEDPNAYITTVEASYTSLVTSGGYERNLVVDGKEYCHIIDPKTGYPADYVLSATAIHFNSDEADLYSTAMFLMTPEEAMEFAEKYKFRAIIVDKEGNLHDFGPLE